MRLGEQNHPRILGPPEGTVLFCPREDLNRLDAFGQDAGKPCVSLSKTFRHFKP
ncbi:MAG: hypothetical protein M3P26_07340 [Gemmatimonadota bacterium]|nr:hypothetical protein [Gemmatimonadota bacterium]